MTAKLDNLLAEALRLSSGDRQRLLELLEAAQKAEPLGVREAAAIYQSQPMRSVTVTLPDELAERAGDAGLLGSEALEDILRRALQARDSSEGATPRQERRLVEKNGLLVAEALPGERRITTDEVRDILNGMEW